MIRDPELIKEITVKDFDHFDRQNEFYRTGQELFQLTSLQRAYLFLSAQFPNIAKEPLEILIIRTKRMLGLRLQKNSATTLVMSVHELALNPAVQDTLYQEVRTFKETYGQLTYENVNSMKYLDGVINESMRKWSPAIVLDRMCQKAYDLPPPRAGGKPFKNKHNITPFSFMPFGAGPRNCIGSRFALLELKVLLYNLILNFKILKCEKTMDPIRLQPADF
ncbi:Cytochrome P450, partial [Operophtera brumata]